MLDIRDLRAGYVRGRMIVDGVDLRVEAGEILTVIGQNSAGKSTLLKGIAGVARVRSGNVRLDGADVSALGPQALLARGLAYISQGRSLFPRLTVAENLRMGGYLLRDTARLHPRVAAVQAEFPDLVERHGQYAASLSGGQQRMLELARTLVMQPRVPMLDEPSIGLAPRVVDALFAVLRRLPGQDCAVLMVEQNVRRAL